MNLSDTAEPNEDGSEPLSQLFAISTVDREPNWKSSAGMEP